MRISAAIACAGLALLVRSAPAAPLLEEVESAHYVLRSEGSRAEAEEWVRVLEAAWPQYEAFFEAAPRLAKDERLRVFFFEDVERWREAIRKASGKLLVGPPVGGYYDPISRGTFFWRQPSEWWTRTLLIHEAAHQFHFLARTGNSHPQSGWYVEGIAEHLSHHTWDGKTLRLGVVPPVSLEDYSGRALEAARAKDFRLEALLARGAAAPRPESMHLVRYLRENPKTSKRFATFAEKLDHGTVPDEDMFAAFFGPVKAFETAWKAWLPTVQQPLLVSFVAWDSRAPDAVRGKGATIAVCRTREAVPRIGATFRTPEGSWRAGLLLQWIGPKDYTIFLIEDGARSVVDRWKGDGWTRLGDPVAVQPSTDGLWRVEAVRKDGKVSFSLNGRDLGARDLAPGPMGLALDHCTVDFTDLRIDR